MGGGQKIPMVRRPHHKSRLGCQTCKRRKVKCDEVKPQCGNCIRFGVFCDFEPLVSQSEPPDLKPAACRRGRPRSNWASWAEQIRLSSQATISSRETLDMGLNIADIEVYHHYIMHTALTVEEDSEARLWREGVPRLGFQHPCILDLVLAFSAYHMARLRPNESAKFDAIAGKHSTTALRAATLLLREMHVENSPALYITSVLVCFISLAQGPCPGNLFLVAENWQVPWLALFRGVKLVISNAGWSSIFSGPLAEYLPQSNAQTQTQKESTTPVDPIANEDWRMSLLNVSNVVDLCQKEEVRKLHKKDLEVLRVCFEATFGKGKHAATDAAGKMEIIMSWIFQLEDSLVEGLSEKDPISLIILGHFCVLMHTLRGYWFMQGWAQHVIQEILQISEASRQWLNWPMQFINGGDHSSAHDTPRVT